MLKAMFFPISMAGGFVMIIIMIVDPNRGSSYVELRVKLNFVKL